MNRFAVNEARMLFFHRVVLDQLRRSPNLGERAKAVLAKLRTARPSEAAVWQEWEQLLAAGADAIAAAVLAATPQGGLLRANSPIAEALSDEERNALWQRVGLQQFVAYFLAAADELGLLPEEMAAVAGVSAAEVASWRQVPPLEMTQATLDALKGLVAIRSGLERLFPDTESRRAWLRQVASDLGAAPLSLLTAGAIGRVQEWLGAAVRPLLGSADRPSH